MMEPALIQQKIHETRAQKVMLDFDLAILYEVPTKALNQAVKRNLNRFPEDFMFQLTQKEWSDLATIRSQFVTAAQKKRNLGVIPYAFTEHGVTMLASILRSDKAVGMNIAIVRAFISLRQFALNYKDLAEQVAEIRRTVENHDERLNKIYQAIETLLTDKDNQQALENREMIGFKTALSQPLK